MQKHIEYKSPQSILTKTGGYLEGYSHSLNPYTGCAYGCEFCYVRQMPVGLFRKEAWGTWVDVKQVTQDKLYRELRNAKKKGPVTIFMSSSTDPYQPIEMKTTTTRHLLEVLVDEVPDFLFVQTRSPFVTRDLDLLTQMKSRVRISMTIETDCEDVRRAFAPSAPPIQARMQAIKTFTDAGFDAQVAVAPLLPHSDNFAQQLAEITSRVCIDDFFMGDGSGGRRTERMGIKSIYDQHHWSHWYRRNAHHFLLAQLNKHFDNTNIFISQEGFLPF
ncbi:SPL family radical SAM protein [Tuberibacillus sp. Marseille-P3662]|uniref:SPL family radical SAM protein n=1 Tax=Tuberibacillus sp. Marseille-P3662 TaxID=1965358 RepID=UPI000A1CE0AC|nr:radical SAM protein [Tuberibacillus sp. Marseille-P3662]